MLSLSLIAMLILAGDPEADRQLALAHFNRAELLFNQARYPEAIAQFEAAYRIRPHGDLLFNLGKCFEQMGDAPKALEKYRAYLAAVPDAKDADLVGAAIAELERHRERVARLSDLPVATQPPATAPVPPLSPLVSARPAGGRRLWTWVAAGAATAALAGGVGLGLGANEARAEMLREQHPNPQVQQLHDAAASRALGANIAYAAAGAAAVTAIVLFFFEPNGAD